ncbi:THO complex subunit 1 transcription elongation factor-domain-containing protein [Suillus fuscotomentosus]|uniref:THO complex subunit 1 transcription elongation factor-domain-containing protein n=1 Tax=Suillus fuscotomentosus TaxID=1912939 RepID=A0AAD4EE10_9AGAM|nr:THO complex subunit 1 transcription elongation factor-domain-containing protein [Suillus fuscotomentosus]KAG1904509.1 THO complex subunit 1 transcription elongation factor-domain-containing protein [Suillus fuscotomentosus]
MNSQTQSVQSLLKSFPQRPFDQKSLHELVGKEVEKFQGKSSADNVKSQWEFLLKNEVFTLAATEGSALKCDSTSYYNGLRDRLDLVLTFTEHDVCEATFPFTVLQDLLETQTITSCSQIFSWIESSASRLTKDMVPQKGKALILLRTLNDLLRRLSKMGSTTIFCGRILTFLSGVFPLGERSGVNLRGEYGPMWEGVKDVEKKDEYVEAGRGLEDSQKMEVDAGKKESADSKDKDGRLELCHDVLCLTSFSGFYTTFWSLQLPFSRPPLFAFPNTFGEFKDAVDKVLPVIKEATTKERAMMGNRGTSGTSNNLKRKREPELGETSNNSEYFFAKFLTSPDLLNLEIADTHFRRQVLFQLLILLHHLLSFTKVAKAVWSTPRNRSLQMDFTLESADAQWVHDTITKVSAELRSTAPNGPTFADTVNVILDREKNWVKWKNDLCAPFDREPWSAEVGGRKVGMEEATREARSNRKKAPESWKWNLGSESLTEIWEMGYRDLSDLQNPFQPGDVKDFVKKVKQEDARIDMRRKQLVKNAERLAQARAKAAALQESSARQETPAPASTPAEPSKVELPAASFSALLSTPSISSSPLHPSLPPKPGSSPVKSFLEAGASSPARPPITLAPPSSTIAAPTPTPSAAASVSETPSISVPPPASSLTDDQIARYEENRQRWSWLALRTARDQYLQHFGKIGTGDVVLLANEIEIEKEREKNQKTQKAEEMRVLVTGGAGYIGSHVIYALQQTRRYKVISADNYHNSFPGSLTRVAQIAQDTLPENPSEADKESTEIDVFQCDLTNSEQIKGIFERYGKGGIWGVVHIAAYKAVGESVEIPLTYYANNVAATVSLLQTMSDFDCTRIVYSSSATVYGTPPVIPIPETTRLKADSPYGKTKVMSEMVIDDLCHAEPNRWRAISLRYFNPAGAHPSGLIGEDPRGRPGNLLPLLAHMAIGRVDAATLQVFGNDYPTPDGTCVRDYLHVLDLASGHLLALDALAPESAIFDNCPDDARYKAYNLGKGKGMSVLQIVEAMRKATGFDFKYEVIGRRRGDVPDLTADPALAERELGFKAPQPLEVMCRDLWNWQSMNPQGYTQQ